MFLRLVLQVTSELNFSQDPQDSLNLLIGFKSYKSKPSAGVAVVEPTMREPLTV
jgi:hypothetical protein